jgi:hypothetical protein
VALSTTIGIITHTGTPATVLVGPLGAVLDGLASVGFTDYTVLLKVHARVCDNLLAHDQCSHGCK